MEDPISHDLRAASTISRRACTRAEKYYSFRFIKPGQLHQPHYRLVDSQDHALRSGPYNNPLNHAGLFLSQSTHANSTPIEHLTPRDLYKEAQCWPRPPTYHHRHSDKRDKRGAVAAYDKRKVGQNDIGRVARGAVGPEQIGRYDDQAWDGCGGVSSCSICLEQEGAYEDDAWWEEAELAETLWSHQQGEGQILMEDAVERWEGEQREQLDRDGWSVLSYSVEDSDTGREDGDFLFEWEVIDL